jgi:RNAse (barnase) inhibitor barstar
VRLVQLDGSLIDDKATFLAAVAEALAFPAYFGMNWDALNDCLRDVTEPTEVVWAHSRLYADIDPEGFAVALRCFERAEPVTLRLA